MLPTSILVLLSIFVIIYIIGLILSIISIVEAIKRKSPVGLFASLWVLFVYLAFCISLIL